MAAALYDTHARVARTSPRLKNFAFWEKVPVRNGDRVSQGVDDARGTGAHRQIRARRVLIPAAAMSGDTRWTAPAGTSTAALESMQFPYTLPPLPFEADALRPVISAKTLRFHHGAHQRAHIHALNKAIDDTEFEAMPLKAIIQVTAGKAAKATVFNNAAQAWNHAFYWDSLVPEGGRDPPPVLRSMIEASFGTVAACRQALQQAAVTQFGAGWTWLVLDGKRIRVLQTKDAETPLTSGKIPLLTIDVWEHAYYLDYQNRRADYVAGVVDKLLNWKFAAGNLAS